MEGEDGPKGCTVISNLDHVRYFVLHQNSSNRDPLVTSSATSQRGEREDIHWREV